MSDNPPTPWPPPSWSARDPNESYLGPPPTGAARPEPFQPPPAFPEPGFPSPTDPASGAVWVSRPSSVIAVSVLCYVMGGMLIVAGFVLFLGASVVRSIDDLTGSNNVGTAVELIIDALLNFGVAGLFIAGAAMFTGGRTRGRQLLTIAAGICLVDCIYWALIGRTNTIIWTIVFAILSLIALALAWTKEISEWLRVTTMPNTPGSGGSDYYQF
jgi:hypothetical protein